MKNEKRPTWIVGLACGGVAFGIAMLIQLLFIVL